MKKKIFAIIALLIFFIAPNVKAKANLDVSLIGNNTFDDKIVLNLKVDNLIDFNENTLDSLKGDLAYDQDKIELVAINSLNGYHFKKEKNYILKKGPGVPTGNDIISFIFRNKKLKDNEKTTISFKNITASDGIKNIPAKNTIKQITYIKPTVNNENANNNQVVNIPQNQVQLNNTNYKQKYTKTAIQSQNNNLSQIVLSEGTINFSNNVLYYDVVVDDTVDDVYVTAIPEDIKSNVIGNGIHKLQYGNNLIKIQVFAENGQEKIYTLNIRRKEKLEDFENETNNTIEEEPETGNIYYLITIIVGSIVLLILIITIAIIKRK